MKTAIIGSGVIDDYAITAEKIRSCDYVICADGGIAHLNKMKISPDVVIGDFDSSDYDSVMALPIMSNTEIIKCNPEKDNTDMQLCIDYALKNGAESIVIFAALGGRVDHELSNIFHLEYINKCGAEGMIFSVDNRIYITNSSLTLPACQGYKMSVIPLTEKAEGVCLSGVYYPLNDATIVRGSSLGISNEIVDSAAKISVKRGTLLVFHSRDCI